MQIEPNPGLIRTYRYRYSELRRVALTGSIEAQRLLRAQRKWARFWSTNLSLDWLERLASEIAGLIDYRILVEDCQRLRGRLSPIPRIPELLSKPLSVSPVDFLIRLFAQSVHADCISNCLSHSLLTPGELRFRTDWKEGRLRIIGDNSATLSSLAGIGHEVGHVLVETVRPDNGFSRAVVSEGMAQSLEMAVIERVLTDPADQRTWCHYQNVIDSLNYYCFLWECHRAGIPLNFGPSFDPHIFDPSLLLLRETLFTAAGYQAVYAAASLLRRRVIASGGLFP